MADPGYPANRHFVSTMEGRPILIPVGPETDYQLTPELVEKHWTDRTIGVMVANPSNPTGTSIKQDILKDIHRVVQANQGTLIVDEIYHGITFGVDACSSLEFADDIFVINSFSKYFAMTGWRLGWVTVHDADDALKAGRITKPLVACSDTSSPTSFCVVPPGEGVRGSPWCICECLG